MDFLNNIVWDNTLKSYFIVLAFILACFILKRYFSRYIASVLFNLIYRIWKNLDKKSFIDLVVEPLEWFLVILVSVFSIDKLNFPQALEYKIYGYGTQQFFEKIGVGIIIISFAFLLLRIIDFIALVLVQKAAITDNKEDDQLVVFLRDFLKIIVGIICFLLVLKACFNQPVGTFLTSLSIVGAAIALAAKESLENLIASFIIFFDKPFVTGDTVKINAVIGAVEKIGLRSTRIRTTDKTLVTVPNKQMVDSIVDNWSMRTNRRTEIKLDLAINTPNTDIQNIIKKINQKLSTDTASITSFDVYFFEVTKSANTIVVEYYTNPIPQNTFIQLKETYNFFVKQLLDDNKIKMSGVNNNAIVNSGTE
ncbi:MAG: mechanosensitive ion channel [Ferruginibacter sp.]|nr:mechanosensitive ion channel [Ferruginibacter sp.]